jgi:hypothetical protein
MRGVGPERLRQDTGTGPPAGLTLDHLGRVWNVYYTLGYDGQYYADRADGAPRLLADTIEEIDSAIRADWSRWFDLGAERAR